MKIQKKRTKIKIQKQIWAVRQTWGSRAGKWKHQTAKTFHQTFLKIISNRKIGDKRKSGKVGIDWWEISRYFVNFWFKFQPLREESGVNTKVCKLDNSLYFIAASALLAETRLAGQHQRREVTRLKKSWAEMSTLTCQDSGALYHKPLWIPTKTFIFIFTHPNPKLSAVVSMIIFYYLSELMLRTRHERNCICLFNSNGFMWELNLVIQKISRRKM